VKSSFSQNLIQETIKVFKEEDGIELTPEQAELYLQSLAGLFLAFAGRGAGRDPKDRPRPLT
jgi:hypothetical protein